MPSRQYLWQMKQQAKGNCIICGKPRDRYRYRCDVCTAKQRTVARQRSKNQKVELLPHLAESLAITTPPLEPRSQMATEPAATRQSLP